MPNISKERCKKCIKREALGEERLYCKHCDTVIAYDFSSGAASYTGEISNKAAERMKAGFTYSRQIPRGRGALSDK